MGFARRVIAFFIGIIIGVVSIFTGLAIAGSVFKVKDVTAVINKGDVVSDDLGNETVLTLLLKLANGDGVIGDMNTLGDIATNVPEVATRVNKILADEPYKSYASLAGVETFDDMREWKLETISEDAVEAVKKNANVEKAMKAFNLDKETLDVPFLYESKYVAINAVDENDKSEGYNPQAIIDTLAEKAPKGLYYKTGDTFVRAYDDNGTLKNEARNRVIYFDFNEITRVCLDDFMSVINVLLKDDNDNINFDMITFDAIKDLAGVDLLNSSNLLKAMFDGSTSFSFVADTTKITKLFDNKNIGLLYGELDKDENGMINRIIRLFEDKSIGSVIRGDFKGLLDGITLAGIKDALSIDSEIIDTLLDKLGDVAVSDVLFAEGDDKGLNAILDKLTADDVADILNFDEENVITKLLRTDALKGKTLKELVTEGEDGKLGIMTALDGCYIADIVDIVGATDNKLLVTLGDKLKDISIGSLLDTSEDGGINKALKILTTKDIAEILDLGEESMITKALMKSDVSLYDIVNNVDDGVQRLLDSFKLTDIPDIIGLEEDDIITKALAYAGDTTVGDVVDTKKYIWNDDGTKTESDAEEAETGLIHILGNYQLTYLPEILGFTSEEDLVYRALHGKTTTLKEIIGDKDGVKNLLKVFTFDDVAKIVNLKDTIIDRALAGKTNLTLDLLVEEDGLRTVLDDYKFGDVPEILFGLDEEGNVKDKSGVVTRFFTSGSEELKLSVLLDQDAMDKILANYTLDDIANIAFDPETNNAFTRALRGHDVTLKDALADGGIDDLLGDYSLDDVARIVYGKEDGTELEKENILTRAFIGKTDFFISYVINGIDEENGEHTDGITAFLGLFRLNELNGILAIPEDEILYRILTINNGRTLAELLKDKVLDDGSTKSGVISYIEDFTLENVSFILDAGEDNAITKVLTNAVRAQKTIGEIINGDDGIKDLVKDVTFGEIDTLLNYEESNVIHKLLDVKKDTLLGDVLKENGIQNFLDTFYFYEVQKVLGYGADHIVGRFLLTCADQSVGALLVKDDEHNGLEDFFETLTFYRIDKILDLGEDNMITKILNVRNSDEWNVKRLLKGEALDFAYSLNFADIKGIIDADGIPERLLDLTPDITLGEILGKEGSIDNYLEKVFIGNIPAVIYGVDEDGNLVKDDLLTRALTANGVAGINVRQVLDDTNVVLKAFTLNDVADVLNFSPDNIITRALRGHDLTVYDAVNNFDLILGEYKVSDVPAILYGRKDDGTYKRDSIFTRALDIDVSLADVFGEGGDINNLLDKYTLASVAHILNYGNDNLIGRALIGHDALTIKDIVSDGGIQALEKEYTFDDIAYILYYDAENDVIENNVLTRALADKDVTVFDVIDGGVDVILNAYKAGEIAGIAGFKQDSFVTKALNDADIFDKTVKEIIDGGVDLILNAYTFDDVAKIFFTNGDMVKDSMITRALLGKNITLKSVADGNLEEVLGAYAVKEIATILYGRNEDGSLKEDTYIGRALDIVDETLNLSDIVGKTGNINNILKQYKVGDVAYVLNVGEDNLIGRIALTESLKGWKFDELLKNAELEDGKTKSNLIVAVEGVKLGEISAIINAGEDNTITKALTYTETRANTTVGEVISNKDGLKDLVNDVTFEEIHGYLNYTEGPLHELLSIKIVNDDGSGTHSPALGEILAENGIQNFLDKVTVEHVEKIANLTGMGARVLEVLPKTLTVGSVIRNGVDEITSKVYVNDVAYVLGYGEENIVGRALLSQGVSMMTIKEVIDGGVETVTAKYTLKDIAYILYYDNDAGEVKSNIITRALDKNVTVKSIIDGGVDELLKQYTVGDVYDIIGAGNDSVIGRALGVEKARNITVYDIYKNGIDAIADAYTLDDVAKILYTEEGGSVTDNLVTRALLGKDVTIKTVISDGGIDALLDMYTLPDVATIVYGVDEDGNVKENNYLTRALAYADGITIKSVISDGGVETLLGKYNLDDVAGILGFGEDNLIGRALLGHRVVLSDVIRNGGMSSLLGDYVLGDLSYILYYDTETGEVVDNVLTRVISAHDELNVCDIVRDVNVLLKAYTTKDIVKIFKLDEDNILTRALNCNDVVSIYDILQDETLEDGTKKSGLIKYVEAFRLGDIPTIIYGADVKDNPITRFMLAHPDVTVGDYLKDDGLKAELGDFTFGEVAVILDLGEDNIVTKFLKQHDTLKISDVWDKEGIKTLLRQVTTKDISELLQLDENSLATKLLVSVDSNLYDLVGVKNGIQNVLDTYPLSKVLDVIDGAVEKDNVIYKAVVALSDKNEGLTVGQLTKVTDGELGVLTYAKKLTLTDIGVDFTKYELYNVLLVNEDADGVRKEMTIGEMIEKNEQGELGIVAKALDTQLCRFKGVFIAGDNYLNRLLDESAGFSVRQVVTNDGLKDYAKSFTVAKVGNVFNLKTGILGRAVTTFGYWNVGDLLFNEGEAKDRINGITLGQVSSVIYEYGEDNYIVRALKEYQSTTIGEITADGGMETFLKGVTVENVGNIIGEQTGATGRAIKALASWNIGDIIYTDGTLDGYLDVLTFEKVRDIAFAEETDNYIYRLLSATPDKTVGPIINGKLQDYLDELNFAHLDAVLKLGDDNLVTRLLRQDPDYSVGDLLKDTDGKDGIARYLDNLTFGKVKNVLNREHDDLLTRLLDVTPAQSVGKLIDNGVGDYLDRFTFGQLNRVLAFDNDNIITKLLLETRTQSVGELLKEDGIKNYLNTLTLANVRNVTGWNTGIAGRALEKFADWNLGKALFEKDGAKDYIYSVTFDQLGEVAFAPETDDYITRTIKEVGDFTIGRLVATDGVKDLCNQLTLGSIYDILQLRAGILERTLKQFSAWNLGDLLFTEDGLKNKLDTVEIQVIPDLLFKEGTNNMFSRLLDGKTITVGEVIAEGGFDALCDTYKLTDFITICEIREGSLKRALEKATDLTVKDVATGDFADTVLGKYTLNDTAYIVFGDNHPNNILERAFEGDDTTLKEITGENGLKNYLDGYTFNRIANVLNLGEDNLVTEALRSADLTGMTVGSVTDEAGLKEFFDKYKISYVTDIIGKHAGTNNVAYKLAGKLGEYSVSDMLETKENGNLGAYEIAKAELTASDLGINLVDYKLFNKILIVDGRELTIGEIIDKNAKDEFRIVDRIKSMKVSDFAYTIDSENRSVINKVLLAGADVSVADLIDTEVKEWTNADGTVSRETGFIHLAKALKLSDVGVDVSGYKLFKAVLMRGGNEMSIGDIIKQNVDGELGIVSSIKKMNIFEFYKAFFEEESNVVNKILQKGFGETKYTVGNLLDSELKLDWEEDGNVYSETTLSHLLKSLTLDELGAVGDGDADTLLYKISHNASGDALSLRKLIDKDANGDYGVIANVKDLTIEDLGLAKDGGTDLISVIANKGDNKRYTIRELIDTEAKYVWDEEGNKTLVTDGGETVMNHVFTGLTLSGDLSLDIGDADGLLYKLVHAKNADGTEYELTIGQLKDGVNDRKLGEVISADALPGYLNGLLDLTFANLMDEKTYVWTEDGVVEDADGETYMTHVINDVKIKDIVGETDNAVIKGISDLTIRDLSDDDKFKAKIDGIALADVLGGDALVPGTLVYKIAHLADGGKVTVGGINDRIEDLKVGDMVDASGSKILGYLADKKISELNTAVDNMTIGDVVDTDGNNVLTYLANKKINELATAIDGMKISDVVGDTTGNPIIDKMKDLTISDLRDPAKIKDAVNNVALKDVVDVEGNKLLTVIAYKDGEPVTVGGLSARVNEVKIGDLIAESDNEVINAIRNITFEEICDANTYVWDEAGNKTQSDAEGAKTILSHTIDGISLDKVMNITDESTGVIKAFKGLTVGDLNDDAIIKERVNALDIVDVLDVTPDTILEKIAYEKNADGELVKVKVNALEHRVEHITIRELLPDASGKILALFGDKTIKQVGSFDFNEVTLSQVIDIDSTDKIMTKLGGKKLSEMEAGIKELELGDVLGNSTGCAIIDSLATSQIKDLPTAINGLSVETAFGITVFTTDSDKAGNTAIKFKANADGTYTLDNVNGGYYLVKDGGLWLMVLYAKSTSGYTYTKENVTVENVADRMSAVASTLGDKTFYELYLYGFISAEPAEAMKNVTINQVASGMNP